MGIMKFLDKVWETIEEYAPQAVDYVQKTQEKVERKNEQKREEIERYQIEYIHLKDQELLEAFNTEGSSVRKAAIRELLQNRMVKYKNEYSCYSGMSLVNFLIQRTSSLEQKAIIALLEEQGYERDSNNEWSRKQN